MISSGVAPAFTSCKLRLLSVQATGSAADPKPIGLLRLLPRTT
jgi:hypothetical protein